MPARKAERDTSDAGARGRIVAAACPSGTASIRGQARTSTSKAMEEVDCWVGMAWRVPVLASGDDVDREPECTTCLWLVWRLACCWDILKRGWWVH